MRSALTLLAALSTLTLTACDSGGPGPDPGPDPIDMAVTEYLTGLPDWDAFAPDVPEQPPTPTGPPVAEDPVTLDVTTLDDDGNEVILEDVTYTCTSTPYSLADTPEDIVIYDPDRSVLYPGAFVQGRSYVVGSVDALTIPERTDLRVSIPDIANPNGDNFRTVTPNQAEVSNAIGDIIGNAVQDGLSAPSSIDFKMETYHSESQFALAASVSGNYLGFSGSASGSIDRNASETTVAVQFTQRMYTVAVERPASDPASFFTEAFTPARLQALRDRGQIGPDNLPVYVSEVVYGRMMMFTLTSSESESDIRATLQAAYEGIGGSVEGSLSARQQSLLQNSKIAITSYGGDAEATLSMIRSGNWADYFTENAPLSSASPLSYTFRNLGDNSIAAVTEATEYDIRTCDARQATPGTFTLLPAQSLALPFAPDVDGRHVGDVTGDGIDDLIFNRTGTSGNQTVIGVGDGNGGFSTGATFTADASVSWTDYRFRTGDVDGDGDTDLVWVEPGPATLTVYVATATGGNFTMQDPQARVVAGWDTGYEPTLADVDGDGADDLVMNRANTLNRVWVFFAGGDGTFDMASSDGQTLSSGGGWETYTLFPLDSNGDGKKDLVWSQTNSARNIIHHTRARPSRTPTSPYIGLQAFQDFSIRGWQDYPALRTTGDFDGDGRDDILYPNNVGTAIHRAYGLGTGFSLSNGDNAQRVTLRADGDPRITHSVRANVNGDAIDDLVLCILDGVTNKTFVLLGQAGRAGLDDATRVPQLHPEQGIAWGGYIPLVGRFDGDTREDLVWLSTASDNRVYVGLARAD
ncbi:MAG: thiol-activated cytolysin family protein [Bacteroidota bacterium]